MPLVVGGIFALITDDGSRARNEFRLFIKILQNIKQQIEPATTQTCFKRIGVMNFSYQLNDFIII